jgi:hypothetical protein
MAELEVYQVQILNFSNRQRYLVGAAGGFELRLLDKTGSGDYKKWRQSIMILSKN